MSYAQEGAVRKFQAAQAQGREKLGLPAQYGAPVMMPPTNRLGGALQIASQVASIYSGFGGGPLSFGPKAGAVTGIGPVASGTQYAGMLGGLGGIGPVASGFTYASLLGSV